jgi:hypothetical protein
VLGWPKLVGGLRFERDAEPLRAGRIAGGRKADMGEADAGEVPFTDQTRQEIQRPIGSACGGRVKHAPGFLGARRVRFHDEPHPFQLEGDAAWLRHRRRAVAHAPDPPSSAALAT